MSLRRFISVSVIIHLLIAIGIYYLPKAKKPEKQGFSARLVTPEETQLPQVRPPARIPEPRSPQQPERKVPSPARPFPPPDRSPDRPLVPGEGSDTGTPLPRGKQPATGHATAPDLTSEPGSPGKGPVQGAEPPGSPGHSAGLPRQGGSMRSRLFDPGTIAEIAGKDASAKAGRNEAVTFDTRDYRYAGYMNKLRDKIQSIWVYPPSAAAEGKYGDLKMRFTINKDGRLGKIDLVRTSGYKILDDAAMKALKDGEPYWPLPDEWGMESYTILGHFIYSLYGYQQLR